MSGDGFHVHGPHDHELEHAAHKDPAGMAGQLAVMTAILATIGAIFSYMGGATQANAALYKNDAAIKKTEASNQWNYFQAKSSKQNLAELAADLVPADKRATYVADVQRYQKEKEEIKAQAQALEHESDEWNAKSDEQMHLHHRWAQGSMVLQVSIALAAVAMLTRRRWLEWVTAGAGLVGIVLGGLAALHV
jgi:lipopolysaccharide export LptBFGC system permease protein LptF